MKQLFFAVIALFLLCGCGDSSITIVEEPDTPLYNEEDTGTYRSIHFITDYWVPSKIEVNNSIDGIINLVIHGENYCAYEGVPKYEIARKFAEFYGDISYTGYVSPGMSSSLAYPIDKITISCDKDFDATHAAGEPLDDIVRLEYHTFYEYIKNGYVRIKEPPVGAPDGWGDIDKFLYFNTIKAEYATLIYLHSVNMSIASPLIKFASNPTESGEYTFTLAVDINGETLTTTFTQTFE